MVVDVVIVVVVTHPGPADSCSVSSFVNPSVSWLQLFCVDRL